MTDPAPSVWGTFKARDAHAVKDFLVALGFEPTAVYEDGEGGIAHAQLDWPEGGGVMFGSHQPGAEWSLEPGTAGFYVVTKDVAAVHERATELGAEIFRPAPAHRLRLRGVLAAGPGGQPVVVRRLSRGTRGRQRPRKRRAGLPGTHSPARFPRAHARARLGGGRLMEAR